MFQQLLVGQCNVADRARHLAPSQGRRGVVSLVLKLLRHLCSRRATAGGLGVNIHANKDAARGEFADLEPVRCYARGRGQVRDKILFKLAALQGALIACRLEVHAKLHRHRHEVCIGGALRRSTRIAMLQRKFASI